MLPYVLAWVVGLGSLAIYMAAFFFPEIHRKNDFIWSGIGLFYALVLWIYAERLTGGLLLGETAGVALLCWLGWQALTLRRQQAAPDQQTRLSDTTGLQARVTSLSRQLQERLSNLPSARTQSTQPPPEAKTEEVLKVAEEVAEIEAEIDTAIPQPPQPEAEETATSPEQPAAVIEQSTLERPDIEPQDVQRTSPVKLPNLSFDLSRVQDQVSQVLQTVSSKVRGVFQAIPKPQPKVKKPVWTRPEVMPDSETSATSEPVAKEQEVAETPESVESTPEITAVAISETSVPTPTSPGEEHPPVTVTSQAETNPEPESPEPVPERSEPTFAEQEAEIVEALADAEPTEFSVEEIAPETGLAPPAEPAQVHETASPQTTEPSAETEQPEVHSSVFPESIQPKEDIEEQPIAPTPPPSSEATELEESDQKTEEPNPPT